MKLTNKAQVYAALNLAARLLDAVAQNEHTGFKGGDSFSCQLEDQHKRFAAWAEQECRTHSALLYEEIATLEFDPTDATPKVVEMLSKEEF